MTTVVLSSPRFSDSRSVRGFAGLVVSRRPCPHSPPHSHVLPAEIGGVKVCKNTRIVFTRKLDVYGVMVDLNTSLVSQIFVEVE